ncbi:hypothetical protein ACK3YM_12770 [Aeromonas caviae]
MTQFKKPQRSAGDIAADARTGGFVWLSMAIQNLLMRWVAALAGQWSILEAVIHGRQRWFSSDYTFLKKIDVPVFLLRDIKCSIFLGALNSYVSI